MNEVSMKVTLAEIGEILPSPETVDLVADMYGEVMFDRVTQNRFGPSLLLLIHGPASPSPVHQQQKHIDPQHWGIQARELGMPYLEDFNYIWLPAGSVTKDCCLGAGANGQVFLGTYNDQTVAVKHVSSEQMTYDSVIKEAALSVRMTSLGIGPPVLGLQAGSSGLMSSLQDSSSELLPSMQDSSSELLPSMQDSSSLPAGSSELPSSIQELSGERESSLPAVSGWLLRSLQPGSWGNLKPANRPLNLPAGSSRQPPSLQAGSSGKLSSLPAGSSRQPPSLQAGSSGNLSSLPAGSSRQPPSLQAGSSGNLSSLPALGIGPPVVVLQAGSSSLLSSLQEGSSLPEGSSELPSSIQELSGEQQSSLPGVSGWLLPSLQPGSWGQLKPADRPVNLRAGSSRQQPSLQAGSSGKLSGLPAGSGSQLSLTEGSDEQLARLLAGSSLPAIVFGYFPTAITMAKMVENINEYKPRQVIKVCADIAANLSKMHQYDFMHNDVNEDNIILIPSEEIPGDYTVYLIDFGSTTYETADKDCNTRVCNCSAQRQVRSDIMNWDIWSYRQMLLQMVKKVDSKFLKKVLMSVIKNCHRNSRRCFSMAQIEELLRKECNALS